MFQSLRFPRLAVLQGVVPGPVLWVALPNNHTQGQYSGSIIVMDVGFTNGNIWKWGCVTGLHVQLRVGVGDSIALSYHRIGTTCNHEMSVTM